MVSFHPNNSKLPGYIGCSIYMVSVPACPVTLMSVDIIRSWLSAVNVTKKRASWQSVLYPFQTSNNFSTRVYACDRVRIQKYSSRFTVYLRNRQIDKINNTKETGPLSHRLYSCKFRSKFRSIAVDLCMLTTNSKILEQICCRLAQQTDEKNK